MYHFTTFIFRAKRTKRGIMHNIGIITDTNSGLTQAEARALGIRLLPMPITIDGVEYVEEVNLTSGEFFRRLAGGAAVATSMPAPDNVIGCWADALREYERIIYIPMSSALSSSCQSARVFAEDFGGRVLVADNRRISITQKQSVLDALYWRDMGLDADAIVAKLLETAMDASIYLTVEGLGYLKKGGRITPGLATIGTVLNIKPVITIQGGKLDTYRKVRGMKAAQTAMIEAVRGDLATRFAGMPVHLRTAYAGDPALGAAWNERIQALFPEFDVTGDPLPISIACHTGPGTVAMGVFRKVAP